MATKAEIEAAKEWVAKYGVRADERWAEGQIIVRVRSRQHPKVSRESAPIEQEEQSPALLDDTLVDVVNQLRGFLKV